MSEKNFKIGTSGLNLDGGVLSTNALSNAISFNGNLLASQEYVTNALSGVDTDLSDNAGLHIDWNAGTSQFDVNVNSLVGDLDGSGLYVDNNQLAINTNVVATLTDTQDLSNKRIIDSLWFTDGVTITNEGQIVVLAETHEFEVKAHYGNLSLETVAANANVIVSSLYGDIVLNANGAAYIDSIAEGNQITTKSYVDNIVNTNAIAGSLASGTIYVSDADNLNVNVNALVGDLDGSGLYVTGNQLAVNTNAIVGDLDGSGLYVDGVTLAVNTNVIATKEYVDGVATGLDVKTSVKLATTEEVASNYFAVPGMPTSITIDGTEILTDGSFAGTRILLKNQTNASENGIYVVTYPVAGFILLQRAEDANNVGTDLTSGAFTFVESGTANAGKGYVANVFMPALEWWVTWSQFSEAGSLTAGSNIYLESGAINVNVNSLVGDLDGSGLYVDGNQLAVNTNVIATKEYVDSLAPNTNAIASSLASATLYVDSGDNLNVNTNAIVGDFDGSGLYVTGNQLAVNTNAIVGDFDGSGLYVTGNQLAVNVNSLAGTGITVSGNTLNAAPAYITSVDASFAVTDGELSLSNTISIASVELTDSVANVTAGSDVFGNGSTSTYAKGSNNNVGTITGADIADVFLTINDGSTTRTSKLTVVFTGGESPTWTEYGIVDSVAVGQSALATTVSFDSSKNILVNVTGSGTYSVKGVYTLLK